ITRCRGVRLVRTSQPRGCGKTRYALGTFSGSGLPFFRLPNPACPVTNFKSFNRDDMIKRFLLSGRSGFYFSVIERGDVAAESRVEILDRDPYGVTVSDIVRLYLGQTRDPELARSTWYGRAWHSLSG